MLAAQPYRIWVESCAQAITAYGSRSMAALLESRSMKMSAGAKKVGALLFFPLMIIVIFGVNYFATGHVSSVTILLAVAVAIGSPLLIWLVVWLFMKLADVSSKGKDKAD